MSKRPLDEAGIADKLKSAATSGIKNAADRARYGFANDHAALGRLNLGAATKYIGQQWLEWATRQYETGNKNIKTKPTLGDLNNFLQYAFGFQFNPQQLASLGASQGYSQGEMQDMITKQVAGWDAKAARTNDLARQALSKTTPEEYAKLKKAFGKPTQPGAKPAADEDEEAVRNDLANGIKDRRANESFIAEADPAAEPEQDDEESQGEGKEQLNRALSMTFDPKMAFPKLANYMIDKGFIRIARNGQIVAGAAHSGDDAEPNGSYVSKEKAKKMAASQTKDGLSIDIKKLDKLLNASGIGEKRFEFMTTGTKTPQAMANLMSDANDPAAKQNARLLGNTVYAIMQSIVPAKSVDLSKNVTARGSVIDINEMIEHIREYHITMSELRVLKKNLGGKDDDDSRRILVDKLLNGDKEIRRVVFAVVQGLMTSISKVEQPKPAEAHQQEEPAEGGE